MYRASCSVTHFVNQLHRVDQFSAQKLVNKVVLQELSVFCGGFLICAFEWSRINTLRTGDADLRF